MATIFATFTGIIWVYSQSISSSINEEWGAKFVRKQIMFDKYRTILPILHEIEIVRQLANEPHLLEMAKNESNPQAFADGIKKLEQYRTKFQDRSYFTVFSKSKNYYFNNSDNEFDGRQLRYKLSPSESKDGWFYQTIKLQDEFQVNVDKDRTLNVTKVWINYVLRDKGEVVGIVGTGFNFDSFLKESVGIEQKGIQNFFISKNLAIQLAKDVTMIDYASITKKDGTHKSIDSIITNPADLNLIKQAMSELEGAKDNDAVKTLWVGVNGVKHLLGIAYQRDIGWFSVTIFDTNQLTLIDSKNIFVFMSILFLVAMAAVMLVSRHDMSALRVSENKFRAIFNFTNDAIMLLDEKGFIDCNNATLRMFNCSSVKEFCTYHPADLSPLTQPCSTDSMTLASKHINTAMREGNAHFEWVHNRANDGEQFFADVLLSSIDIGNKKILQAVVRDETQRKKIEAEIQTLAFYDALTKLPNRRLLKDRLAHAQLTSKRTGRYGSILFLDLDNFKPLNDIHGHTIGDLLLVEVANRIKGSVRQSDTVSRFGGDEFIVLLDELEADRESSMAQAVVIADKIRISLALPYLLQTVSTGEGDSTVEHSCSTSIGLTLFLGDELSEDEIFHQADSAMYEAKNGGRNQIRQYVTG